MSIWRDIATAPRDGTLILAGSVLHKTRAVVGWDEKSDDEPHWSDVGSANARPALYFNSRYFTHWQSIDELPDVEHLRPSDSGTPS